MEQSNNQPSHKSTRYYIDEFHLLLKEEQTAAYSVWKFGSDSVNGEVYRLVSLRILRICLHQGD